MKGRAEGFRHERTRSSRTIPQPSSRLGVGEATTPPRSHCSGAGISQISPLTISTIPHHLLNKPHPLIAPSSVHFGGCWEKKRGISPVVVFLIYELRRSPRLPAESHRWSGAGDPPPVPRLKVPSPPGACHSLRAAYFRLREGFHDQAASAVSIIRRRRRYCGRAGRRRLTSGPNTGPCWRRAGRGCCRSIPGQHGGYASTDHEDQRKTKHL